MGKRASPRKCPLSLGLQIILARSFMIFGLEAWQEDDLEGEKDPLVLLLPAKRQQRKSANDRKKRYENSSKKRRKSS